jgi:hypothetical protein
MRLPFGLVTTIAWLEEFIRAINEGAAVGLPTTINRRIKAVEEARKEADAIINQKRINPA